MQIFIVLFLFGLAFKKPEIGEAVRPSCKCLIFSQTNGQERGTFTSPNYPKNYPRGIDCLLYTFIAGLEEVVEITFADIDIYKTHLSCVHADYIKLYPHIKHDEINEYTKETGIMCGTDTPSPTILFSSGSTFVLEFHSAPGPPVNSSGFLGYYRFIQKKLFKSDGQLIKGSLCDFIFSSTENLTNGAFYTPLYPSSYPKNIKCSYIFQSRQNERVRLIFEEVNLQREDSSCLHHEDIIKVHDGSSPADSVVKIICGENSAIEIFSTGPTMMVEFIAKSNWPGQGFKSSFQFQLDNQTKIGVSNSTIHNESRHRHLAVDSSSSISDYKKGGAILCSKRQTTASSCDAAFNSDTSKNGTFTSAYYPSSYPPRSHCRFDFLGRGKERIQIVFQDFNLFHPGDDVKECDNIDSLQAFVYIEGRMEKIDSFCGSTVPKSIMSNGPRLMLEFRGIYSSRYIRGFKAAYYFLENYGITSGKQISDYPCAFAYNSSEAKNGTFSSPNYPGPYPRDTECHYFFQGTNTEKVHIHFTYFDVEGVLPCEAISASDFVEFSNFMARDRKYNRHCGQLKEFRVESDRKFFRVTFRSNDRLDGTGFKANYQFIEDVETTTLRPNSGKSKNYSNLKLSSTVLLAIAILILNDSH